VRVGPAVGGINSESIEEGEECVGRFAEPTGRDSVSTYTAQAFLYQPNPLPDRTLRLPSGQEAVDDVVFCASGGSAFGGDALGLTEATRKSAKQKADREVYWAVCELVQNRLKKARSL
jgi:hypothetical protein